MNGLPDRTLDHLRRMVELPDLSGTPYELEAEIGRGGMAVVYQVRDVRLGRSVALKVVEEDRSEASTLAHLEHPGIVPLYDAGVLADGRHYYVMRLVRGQRLDEWLAAEPPLPARLRVFLRIAEAVSFAHSQGVVHRDLKPQNIMTGAFGEVFVVDWGIARIPAAGTPGYRAPQAADPHDPRIDVYALGRVLHDMTGAAPPAPLRAVAARAAAADPDGRYATVDALAADVGRFLDGHSVSAYRENLLERLHRFARRNSVLLLLLGAYLLVRLGLFLLRP
jgi:eukaryotic-like serine/threonine-protein kinase